MTVHLEIPDDLLAHLVPNGKDPARALLEHAVAEAYRDHRLDFQKVGVLLGLQTDMEVDTFLNKRQIYDDYSVEELNEDLAASIAVEAAVRERNAA